MIVYKCILVLASIFGGYYPAESRRPATGDIAFQYLTTDSVLLDIYTVEDAAGILEGYRSHIVSPVCEDRLCYDAELDFFWDILGRFSHFEVDPNKPLTKLDHVPFSGADYEQLNRILLTESPSFIHLRRGELIVKPDPGDSTDVDAVTGATVKAVKQDMVEGAIYTCYTLWHIANGGIVFEIQEHTKRKINEEGLIRKLLRRPQASAHYFLIENMAPQYFTVFLPEVLALAGQYDPFFTVRLLNRLPQELFGRPEVQAFLVQRYARLEPASRQLVLSRLEGAETLSPELLHLLIRSLQEADAQQVFILIQLICSKAGAEPTAILQEMLESMLEYRINPAPASLQLLEKLGKEHPSLQKLAKRIGRTSGKE